VELRDYLEALRRAWLSVVIIAVATLGAAAAVTYVITPQYTATTRLFFGVQGGVSGSDLANGSTFTEKQMSSYAQVSTSPLVLNQVIKQLGLAVTADELAQQIVAKAPADTVILEISATDVDPAQSARIANSIGGYLASVAGDLSPARQDGSQAVRATILATAIPPVVPSSPNLLSNLIRGLALGLAVGIGVALLRRALDTKIRTEQDVQAVTDSSVLGVVPFDSGAPTHPVVMHDDALGARSEAVRRLRTNLQFVDIANETKSIVITSSIPGEGKSTTAVNLAVSLADAGLRVLLIDADLRRPSIAEYLGLEGQVGLTTVLIGRAEVADVVQPWQGSSLDILPAGQVPPNPSELLGSTAMSALLGTLAESYDLVLLDSSPLLPVTDAAVLSRLSGGALVVVGVDQIHRAQLRDAMESLTTVGVNVLGMVLNKVDRRDVSPYTYYTSYSSKTDIDPEESVLALPPVDAPQGSETATKALVARVQSVEA
jgi:succinoglycan biosynthesis transport protein ExoP